MKCARCGRGLTYHRIERDAAFMVFEAGQLVAAFCGLCFLEAGDDLEAAPAPRVVILLPDGPHDARYRVLEIESYAH